jgi:tRNA 2-selenouridine synthase
MTELSQIEDFTNILIRSTPMMDTRAPIEYNQGSFPYTQNLPLMNDSERELVGTCYKNKGRSEAIKLGHNLVQGKVKELRIKSWLEFITNNPHGAMYCYRGGMRSKIAQRWIFERYGIEYPRINGGYKAIRRFIIDETLRIMRKTTPIIIGGQTGSGKTILLNKINNQIDLEGLANHRGSAFGNTTTPQPTQISFENELGIELVKKQELTHLVFEDEGSNIGNLHIPECVQNNTITADLIILETNIDQRISISMDEYVTSMYIEFCNADNENGFIDFSNYWLGSIKKIQKRLGLERYKEMLNLVTSALDKCEKKGNFDGFIPVIEKLLIEYYDPMYSYQIKKKTSRVVFSGNSVEVIDYLASRSIS